MQFKPFPKIPRFFRDITITEKIDGTNASIWVSEDVRLESLSYNNEPEILLVDSKLPGYKNLVRVGSRNRWLTREQDNYGFFDWVAENYVKLANLGPGHHFGEWWGNGIQRNYGLKEKRFSLFNTKRWGEHYEKDGFVELTGCYTVPILYNGTLDDEIVSEITNSLRLTGSIVAPGFMKPEGIIIHHEAGNHLYKVLLENDNKPKSAVENS